MKVRPTFERGQIVNPLTGGVRHIAWIQWVQELPNGVEVAIGAPETWTVQGGTYAQTN